MDSPKSHRHTQTYFRLLIAAGGASLLCALARLPASQVDFHFLLLAVVTLTIGSHITVKIPRLSSYVSVSDAFLLLGILLCGGEAAVLLAALDGLSSTMRLSRRPQTFMANIAVTALSTSVTVWVLRLCFGPVEGIARSDAPLFVTGLCVMGATHYLVNSGLVAVGMALKTGQGLWETWRKYYLWTSLTYFAGASAASIVARLVISVGFHAVLVTTPIIVIIYFTYSTYLKNIEASTRQVEIAEQHVEELSRYIEEQERIREQFAQIEKLSALGVLSSGVAHDFNNTLAGILGRAQLTLMCTPAASAESFQRGRVTSMISSSSWSTATSSKFLSRRCRAKFCMRLTVCAPSCAAFAMI